MCPIKGDIAINLAQTAHTHLLMDPSSLLGAANSQSKLYLVRPKVQAKLQGMEILTNLKMVTLET
jgi:hypothetical protein